jgi:hypothetical protein
MTPVEEEKPSLIVKERPKFPDMEFPKLDLKDPMISKMSPSQRDHIRRDAINAFIKKVCVTCQV